MIDTEPFNVIVVGLLPALIAWCIVQLGVTYLRRGVLDDGRSVDDA